MQKVSFLLLNNNCERNRSSYKTTRYIIWRPQVHIMKISTQFIQEIRSKKSSSRCRPRYHQEYILKLWAWSIMQYKSSNLSKFKNILFGSWLENQIIVAQLNIIRNIQPIQQFGSSSFWKFQLNLFSGLAYMLSHLV